MTAASRVQVGGRFIICSLLALAFSIKTSTASNYPLTSQYLGAQSYGDEHVLLFKLPASISPQLQEQLLQQHPHHPQQQQQQQQQQLNYSTESRQLRSLQHLQPQQYLQQLVPIRTVAPNDQPDTQQYQESPGEQSVSLTIPLSTIRAQQEFAHKQQHPQQQQQHSSLSTRYSFVSQSARPITSRINYSHQPIDYTTMNDGPATVTRLADQRAYEHAPAADSNQRFVEPLSVSYQRQQVQQAPHNITSLIIEQHLRQLAAQHQQQQQQQQAASADHYAPAASESEVGASPSSDLANDYVLGTNQANNNHLVRSPLSPDYQRSTDNQSLLNRLASSSPDLLLRLRGYLKQVSQQDRQQMAAHLPELVKNYTTTNNIEPSKSVLPYATADNSYILGGQETPLADGGGRSAPLIGSTGDNSGGRLGSDKMALNSFLNNQNLSSHEEIKIPLVIIAMPRIVSLKRNQLASGLTPANVSGNSQLPQQTFIRQIIKPSFTNLTQNSQLNSNGSQLLKFTLNSQNQPTSATNYSTTNVTSLNGEPYLYMGAQTAAAAAAGTGAAGFPQLAALNNHLQPAEATSSGSQHTMAPYTRQFEVPVASPLVHQYVYPTAAATVSYDPAQPPAYPTQQYALHSLQSQQYQRQQQQQQQQQQQTGQYSTSAYLAGGVEQTQQKAIPSPMQLDYVPAGQQQQQQNVSLDNSRFLPSDAQSVEPDQQSQPQQQSPLTVNQILGYLRAAQPNYDFRLQSNDQYRHDESSSLQPEEKTYQDRAFQQQQQYGYESNRPLNASVSQWLESRLQSLLNSRPQARSLASTVESIYSITAKQPLVNEGSLSRLRPLFQTADRRASSPASNDLKDPLQRRALQKPSHSQSMLRPSQMLSLMTRAREQQQASATQGDARKQTSVSSLEEKQRPAKMVLMIV